MQLRVMLSQCLMRGMTSLSWYMQKRADTPNEQTNAAKHADVVTEAPYVESAEITERGVYGYSTTEKVETAQLLAEFAVPGSHVRRR